MHKAKVCVCVWVGGWGGGHLANVTRNRLHSSVTIVLVFVFILSLLLLVLLLVVVVVVWFHTDSSEGGDFSPRSRVKRAVARQLERLGLSYVDLYLLHYEVPGY